MQSSTDFGRRVGGHAVLWLAGPIALLVRDGAPALARPASCAAALDLLTVALVRRWPNLPIGSIFTTSRVVVTVIAFGCFAEWCARLTRNSAVALVTAVAFGIAPTFAPALMLPERAAGVALVALFALAFDTSAAVALLLVAVAVKPESVAGCAAALVWLAADRRRGPRRLSSAAVAALAVAIAAMPVLVVRAAHVSAIDNVPAWSACVAPALSSLRAALVALWQSGPVVLALAGLGLFVALNHGNRARVLVAAGVLALASLPPQYAGADAWVAPAMTGVWSLAAVGLGEIVRMTRSVRGGALAATALLVAVPVLELARIHDEERDDVVYASSQGRATLSAITTTLNLVPSDSRFVEEDASVQLLLRAALAGGRRSSKPVGRIEASHEDIAEAVHRGSVFAFPRGQELAGLRGFELSRDAAPPVAGVARIVAERPCRTLTGSWTDLSAEGAHGRIAIVADSDLSSGPIVLYFGGPTDYQPGPDGWPPRVRMGFEMRQFDRRTPEAAARLDDEAKEVLGAGADDNTFKAPFVSRMDIVRTPRSPLELPVVLGPPATGIGRLRDDAAPFNRIAVCDAPPTSVSHF